MDAGTVAAPHARAAWAMTGTHDTARAVDSDTSKQLRGDPAATLVASDVEVVNCGGARSYDVDHPAGDEVRIAHTTRHQRSRVTAIHHAIDLLADLRSSP